MAAYKTLRRFCARSYNQPPCNTFQNMYFNNTVKNHPCIFRTIFGALKSSFFQITTVSIDLKNQKYSQLALYKHKKCVFTALNSLISSTTALKHLKLDFASSA